MLDDSARLGELAEEFTGAVRQGRLPDVIVSNKKGVFIHLQK